MRRQVRGVAIAAAARAARQSAGAAGAPGAAAAAGADGKRVPWADAIAERWTAQIGDHPERERIVQLIGSSLCDSTVEKYGRHVANFIRWCDNQADRPCPLPASSATVARWIAGDVTVGGKVKESSLQPYLSAINRLHEDLDFDKPALGTLIARVRKGLAHEHADSGERGAQRVYLPPPVVESLLVWALDLEVNGQRERELLRAAVAVIVTFVLFARGGTGAALRDGDVRRRSAAGILFTLVKEKGKKAAGVARTLVIPHDAIPGLSALLDKWEAVRGGVPRTQCYFSFRGERREFPSTQIDTWLRLCLAHHGYEPPAGELWSGHSLRKGAASGAGALDVALHRICYAGGWKSCSRVVLDYIDPTCPLTSACRRFFGWLKPC